MKRRLLIMALAIFTTLAAGTMKTNAQAVQLPFSEDFESFTDNDDFVTNSGWTIIDADGDGYNWYLYYDSFDELNVMVSQSYDDGALTPENYLVTPLMAIPGLNGQTVSLSFQVAASGGTYFQEHYKVIVALGNTPADLAAGTVVLEETIGEENSSWNYGSREIDLSQFAGQEIHIAFVHRDSEDNDRLLLNNVAVELVENNLFLAEDFEDYDTTEDFFATSGWTSLDADGDANEWFLDAGDLNNAMASESYQDGALTPENYLITPNVTLPTELTGGTLLLAFDIAATGNNYFEEHYKVVVSTGGATQTDFPDENIVLEETLTENESGRRYVRRHITLDQFAGEAIHVAFVHYQSTDQDMLVLDNVMVQLVNSATIYPGVVSFDPQTPENVAVNVAWYGATQVTGVEYAGDALAADTDYSVAGVDDQVSTLTVMSGFLEALPEGDHLFQVSFDTGDPVEFTVRISSVAENAMLQPTYVDFYPSDPVDVQATIAWGDATQVESIMVGEEVVDQASYTVAGDLLTIPAAYFAEMDPGYVVFSVAFDQGDDAMLVVRIFDEEVQQLPFTETFTGIEALGEDTPEAWLPNGWTTRDADGDEFNWFWRPVVVNDVVEYGRMTSQSAYQDESGSYLPLTPDNWLISPPIQLNSITAEDQEINLTFEVAPGASTSAFRQEKYSIMLSYTGNDPEAYEELYVETLSQDHPQNEFQPREVELSFYEGQEVYIAFRHHDVTDMDRLLVTNVEVRMIGDDTGIQDPTAGLQVYPNPARNSMTVESDVLIHKVRLIGMLGNVLLEQEVSDTRYFIQTDEFPQGTYILQAITEKGTLIRQVQLVR